MPAISLYSASRAAPIESGLEPVRIESLTTTPRLGSDVHQIIHAALTERLALEAQRDCAVDRLDA
jgi:hypothetical protein